MRAAISFAAFAALLAISPASMAQTPAGAAWSSAETVEIQLSNYKFAPSNFTLRQGQAYRLHLVNAASGGHSFSAPEFFASAQVDPEDAAAVSKGKVEVEGGQTRDIRVIPQKAGTYEFQCTHFLHATMGMKGRITVE
jgi:uncharacterized cupredoxin-like copper-binding protein